MKIAIIFFICIQLLGIHLQHFENLLGNPPKITHEPITRIISKQLDIKLDREELKIWFINWQ